MIVLAYDHRAFDLMLGIKEYLKEKKLEFVEFASPKYDKTDSYSEFAKKANEYILSHENAWGIYACRSGIGVSMMANRFRGIRAGVCYTEKLAFLGRNDDDINVLVLATEEINLDQAKKLIDIYLSTPFEGGRHIPRLEALDE